MSVRARWIRPLALGLAGVVVGVLAYATFAPGTSERSAAPTATSTTAPPAYSAKVYEIILPSLVFIRTLRDGGAGASSEAIGSGVVVNTAGQIMTAYHVVRGASTIAITFADGTEAGAKVVSSAPENDTAVLQPDRPPGVLVPAVLGSTGGVRIGDEAFAAGNPLGLTASISAGVVSGLNRTIPLEDGPGELEGLIQFDAAVNPGSSGGPLLNRAGQVIGIVTALANPTSQSFFSGIGFAVPIGAASGAAGGPDQ